MLWLEKPPVLRWIATALVVLVAAWSEFGPSPSTQMTFLAVDVAAGTPITSELVQRRSVPSPGFATVEPSGVAATDLQAGEPLVASMIGEFQIPEGWLLISAPIPHQAVAGTPATGIILDGEASATEFPAFVVEVAPDDPFNDASGTLAVPPEWLASAAAAANRGQLVVGVQTPG